jgi:hypothetical protein
LKYQRARMGKDRYRRHRRMIREDRIFGIKRSTWKLWYEGSAAMWAKIHGTAKLAGNQI